MQDTDERSMRVLLARGAAWDEPPLGSLINDVVRAGFRARRRRRALTAGSALAAAVVLAAGITSAIGHPPWSARASQPAAGSATVTWTQTPVNGTVPSWFRFAAPQAPHPGWTGPRARTTAKSGTQLLLDDVAGGTEVSHLQATLKNLRNELGVRAAIRGPAGNGSAEMQMSRHGQQPGVCDSAGSIVCRTYRLPGGTKIEEDLAVAGLGPARHDYYLSVVIRRPHGGVSAAFTAMNYSVTGPAPRPLSAAPPVRMAALVDAAQDLRWGWTMNRGFVAQAEHLRLGGDSGRFWG
jgi:hypothetical protein